MITVDQEDNRRLLLYKEMLALAVQQFRLVEKEDFGTEETSEQADRLVAKRQHLMGEIDGLGTSYSSLSEDEKDVIQAIIDQDKASRATLEAKKIGAAAQLHNLKKGKQTVKAYQPETIQFEGFFIDKKE